MFSRVTQLAIDPSEVDLSTAVERFRQEVLPSLRYRDGYLGLLALATPEGRGILITLWQNEDAATAESGGGAFYSNVVRHYLPILHESPRHERYAVVLADGPVLAME
jgi:hypothetical protein